MHEAALKANVGPDPLFFIHADRVARRKLPALAALLPQLRKQFHEEILAEILQKRKVSSRGRQGHREE